MKSCNRKSCLKIMNSFLRSIVRVPGSLPSNRLQDSLDQELIRDSPPILEYIPFNLKRTAFYKLKFFKLKPRQQPNLKPRQHPNLKPRQQPNLKPRQQPNLKVARSEPVQLVLYINCAVLSSLDCRV